MNEFIEELPGLYTVNDKILLKEIKEDLDNWKSIPCSWVRKLNIVKMVVPMQESFGFSMLFIKIPISTFSTFQKWESGPSNLCEISRDSEWSRKFGR